MRLPYAIDHAPHRVGCIRGAPRQPPGCPRDPCATAPAFGLLGVVGRLQHFGDGALDAISVLVGDVAADDEHVHRARDVDGGLLVVHGHPPFTCRTCSAVV